MVVQTSTATSILLMKRGRGLVTRNCSDLGHLSHISQPGDPQEQQQEDRLVTAVFDSQRVFRVYGVTAAGELVSLVVPAGVAAHQCRVSMAHLSHHHQHQHHYAAVPLSSVT